MTLVSSTDNSDRQRCLRGRLGLSKASGSGTSGNRLCSSSFYKCLLSTRELDLRQMVSVKKEREAWRMTRAQVTEGMSEDME